MHATLHDQLVEQGSWNYNSPAGGKGKSLEMDTPHHLLHGNGFGR